MHRGMIDARAALGIISSMWRRLNGQAAYQRTRVSITSSG
jgi:hypothetical protein